MYEILKQMILVSSPRKPFTLTAKLAVRRQAVIANYEQEIDALYDAVNETSQVVKHFPKEWTKESSLEFARNLIGNILKDPVEDDNDIFQRSCDRSAHVPLTPVPVTDPACTRNQPTSNVDS